MLELYRVVCGPVRDGFDPNTVLETLIYSLNIDPDKAARYVNGTDVIADESVNKEAIRSKGKTLHNAGLQVKLKIITQDQPPESAAVTPPPPPPPLPPIAPGPGSFTPAGELTEMRLEFTGRGGEYFMIWLTNTVLTILTLGIYSAWAKVKRNRYFYGHTKLDGTGFEYLADPKRILLGRIIALALLIAFGLADLVPLLALPAALAAMLIMPWLMNNALRFRMHNTAYRNIRFRFKARYGEAFAVYILWPALAAISLGLLWPCMLRRHQRFAAEHTAYGATSFYFHAPLKPYYEMLGLMVLAYIVTIVVLVILVLLFPVSSENSSFAAGSIISLPIFGLLFLIIGSIQKTAAANILYRSTSIAGHRFNADLRIGGFFRLLLVNTILTVLTLGLYSPWAKVKMTKYKVDHIKFLANGDLGQFAAAEKEKVSALGEEIGAMLDLEIGL